MKKALNSTSQNGRRQQLKKEALSLKKRGLELVNAGNRLIKEADRILQIGEPELKKSRGSTTTTSNSFSKITSLSIAQSDFQDGSSACMAIAFLFCFKSLFTEIENRSIGKLEKIVKDGVTLWKTWQNDNGSTSKYASFSEIRDTCGVKHFSSHVDTKTISGFLLDDANKRSNVGDAVTNGWTEIQYNIESALNEFNVSIAGSAVFNCRDYSIAIWKRRGKFYVFNSHHCNTETGLKDCDGFAVLMQFDSILYVLHHFRDRFPLPRDVSVDRDYYRLKYSLHVMIKRGDTEEK